ncbi:hypothetical protein PC116_g24231 [Phytophthora cactorum]|uniref:Uncharacterized protein n=2 Tax=Phytophthora cactorum TaxID=29920 RepID=A0A329SCX0_9STRA|nr:hypothetical protein PC117_g23658 [Phytophthora cactorum]KAG3129534.1 hypothetical protein C6341_g24097 [Phytophthora cactorum]KAG4227377.1 hypothetical protein PC116_g24231 [Phytophthora cactorum]RAW34717.1 hypothetical protein PC110_g8984 [Phytophthora cactorum]
MKHLRVIKCRATLRKVTPLAPVLRIVTRWSSTFNMVERYVKLRPALFSMDYATFAKHDIVRFLHSDEESEHVTELLENRMDLNEVTKALQDSTLIMVGARRAFDWVGRQYPTLKARLAADAAIVYYPALESGITKIISGSRLTTREQEACKAFKLPATNTTVEETSRSFLAPVFQKASEPRTAYIPLAWVHPTSNECERFFSQVKLVFTDLRKSMDVNTLEVLMFLAYNRDSWDIGSVQAIRRKMRK